MLGQMSDQNPILISSSGSGGKEKDTKNQTTVTQRRGQSLPGVHNAKAEECATPRIGGRNIEI